MDTTEESERVNPLVEAKSLLELQEAFEKLDFEGYLALVGHTKTLHDALGKMQRRMRDMDDELHRLQIRVRNRCK